MHRTHNKRDIRAILHTQRQHSEHWLTVSYVAQNYYTTYVCLCMFWLAQTKWNRHRLSENFICLDSFLHWFECTHARIYSMGSIHLSKYIVSRMRFISMQSGTMNQFHSMKRGNRIETKLTQNWAQLLNSEFILMFGVLLSPRCLLNTYANSAYFLIILIYSSYSMFMIWFFCLLWSVFGTYKCSMGKKINIFLKHYNVFESYEEFSWNF